jgi:uncharacterized membrane protein YdbT with pleckstrin-like domain
MSYIKENLSKNENIVSLVALSKYGLIMPLVWLVIFFPVGIYQILVFATTKQGITSKKVIKKTGVIGVTTDEIRNVKIESVEIKQGILGRIFNYGTVIISGTGGSKLSLNFVNNPKKVKQTIDNLIDNV